MDFNKLDYSRFLYNPSDPDLLAKLVKHKEFNITLKNLSKRKVVQYIILMYDKNNDEVRAEYPFYPQRKMEVAKCVKLVTGVKATRAIEDLLIGKNEDVNRMIIRYLTLFNNPSLLMLASYYEIYININREAYSGNTDRNIINNLEKVNAAIGALTEEVYGGKDETELRQELYKSIEEQSLGIRPEEIAEALQSEKNPLKGFNPYQSEYLPEDIRFLDSK